MIKNIIQVYEGDLSPENQMCIKSVRAALSKENNWIFIDKLPAEIDRSKGLRNASDIFRFDWLIKNPFDLWLDCDVKMGKRGWPDFADNGKPYFANAHGQPDTWAIYPNGRIELIEKVYKQALKIINYNLLGCEICKILNTMRSEINLIENGYFIHTSKR
jgi:hypothetical protein